MNIVPPVTAGLLSALPEEIRLVVYRGHATFVGVAADDPERSRWLVVRDGQHFVRLLAQDQVVIAIAGPYLLEPDLSSLRPDRLGPAANAQLFMRGSDPYVVMRLGSAPGWRIFNLTTGTSSSTSETDAPSFSKWRLGVAGPVGSSPQWLMQVS